MGIFAPAVTYGAHRTGKDPSAFQTTAFAGHSQGGLAVHGEHFGLFTNTRGSYVCQATWSRTKGPENTRQWNVSTADWPRMHGLGFHSGNRIGLDATSGFLEAQRIRIAHDQNYGDVTPVRGVYKGHAGRNLSARRLPAVLPRLMAIQLLLSARVLPSDY